MTEEEVRRLGAQLDDLLKHVEVLSELDTASVPATAQVIESVDVARDDVLRGCLDREQILEQAPQREGVFFRVPRIIAE